ncbi:hypothetical protein UH38_24100 [Aliterella atlantica CENA595]|uniref:Tyr recombinase domain-containing protein n=1 Tax=Aliterella atlantica CENA595 TaxID=1618023 RepID=A0A0D8ZQC4_9CYAN|nr:hypothetical protein UH38_24100 [Aliterella atlantica CENA595]
MKIERFRDSLRLRWSHQSKRYSLTIGKDSRDTLKIARAKAQAIDSDITFNRFDDSLVKYGKCSGAILQLVSVVSENQIELRELWDKFLADKVPHLKAKTQQEYRSFTKILDKLGAMLTFDALETKRSLLAITTADQARRTLLYLSACCKWGIKHKLIKDNPYDGLANEMPKRRAVSKHKANAFTEEERDAVINAFRRDVRSGTNYNHYAPIVEFWFLTGCRPSEAVGLTWDKISKDCSSVTFNGSVQLIDGRHVWSSGSKNNKTRIIATSPRLQALLQSIKHADIKPGALVFPSPTGKPINYDNFTRRAWNAVVDPIKPGTTPYNCRDTFITNQLLKGIASAVIAKWCDTSTVVIDKDYADIIKLSQLRPRD